MPAGDKSPAATNPALRLRQNYKRSATSPPTRRRRAGARQGRRKAPGEPEAEPTAKRRAPTTEARQRAQPWKRARRRGAQVQTRARRSGGAAGVRRPRFARRSVWRRPPWSARRTERLHLLHQEAAQAAEDRQAEAVWWFITVTASFSLFQASAEMPFGMRWPGADWRQAARAASRAGTHFADVAHPPILGAGPPSRRRHTAAPSPSRPRRPALAAATPAADASFESARPAGSTEVPLAAT